MALDLSLLSQAVTLLIPRAGAGIVPAGAAAECIAVRALRWAAIGFTVSAAVAALYIAKSAAGINILPGPSPLHGLLYQFVR